MGRFPRLFLTAAILLVTLGRPTPVAAVSAGCSTLGTDGRPLGAGQLFVQASYGIDESTLFRFYVDGPESRLVYEGSEPGNLWSTLTGLTPGSYTWMLDRWIDNGDGTTSFYRKTLATCTVSGLVDVPSLKGKTEREAADALAAAGLSLGPVSSAASATVATGDVISQKPAAGTDVAPGSRISITISTGPAPATPAPTPKPTPTSTPVAAPVVTPAPSTTPEGATPTTTPSVAPLVVSAPATEAPSSAPAVDRSTEAPLSFGVLAAALPFGVIALLFLFLRARR